MDHFDEKANILSIRIRNQWSEKAFEPLAKDSLVQRGIRGDCKVIDSMEDTVLWQNLILYGPFVSVLIALPHCAHLVPSICGCQAQSPDELTRLCFEIRVHVWNDPSQ